MSVRELQTLPPAEEKDITPTGKNLTDMQREFVERVVDGNDGTTAARLAGYSSPAAQAYHLARIPHVAQEIRARIAARLNTQGATVGLNTLIKIANDDTAPKGARVQAANSLLDRAGFVSKVLDKQRDADEKPISEMSASELEGFIGKLASKLDHAAAKRGAEDAEFTESGPVTIENP